MKVLFLSSLNPNNINYWSGTLFFIFNSLKKRHTVNWIGNDVIDNIKRYHVIQCGQNSPFIPECHAEVFGRMISQIISESNYDVIVARDYYFISHLKTNIPVIYIGDTTFDLFKDYLKISETPFALLAERIEQKAISNADLVVYSSEWAKESAVKHYGAEINKIKVIEFGANLPEKTIPKQITFPQMDACRLLFIGKNWQNKGGEKAYQTYLLLREKGLDCSLTIIGCNPAHLDTTDPHLHVIPFIDKSDEGEQRRLDEILRNTLFFYSSYRFRLLRDCILRSMRLRYSFIGCGCRRRTPDYKEREKRIFVATRCQSTTICPTYLPVMEQSRRISKTSPFFPPRI